MGEELEESEISYKYVEKTAQEVEYIGYDLLWVTDLLLNPRKGEQYNGLEAWTTITDIATATNRIKLGHSVLYQLFPLQLR